MTENPQEEESGATGLHLPVSEAIEQSPTAYYSYKETASIRPRVLRAMRQIGNPNGDAHVARCDSKGGSRLSPQFAFLKKAPNKGRAALI